MRKIIGVFSALLLCLSFAFFSGSVLAQTDASRFDASSNVGLAEGFETPPPGFGEVPFWWWTGEKLNVERLRWQLDELAKKGISGVQVNYAHQDVTNEKQPNWLTYPNEPEILIDEWFDVFEQVAARCRELNMGVGLSGYTLDFQHSPGNLFDRLIYSDEETQSRTLYVALKTFVGKGKRLADVVLPNLESPDATIQIVLYPLESDGTLNSVDYVALGSDPVALKTSQEVARVDSQLWVYGARRIPHTLNPLHPDSGKKVVERFFEPFQTRALASLDGKDDGKSTLGLNYFFQDELQLGTGETIWTDDLAEQFESRKGYSYWTAIPAMFDGNVGKKAEKYRLDYMDVRVRLAEERYFIPCFKWNADRGRIYACDAMSRGKSPGEFCDYFSATRWYTAPGHDTPGGNADFIKNKVSSSIAHFYGRPRVWLEGYHSFGWGASPERLLFATNENYLFGANLLNLHGLYYTTYGGYWEWAPPCYHFRQPYWETFGSFLKYFERLSFALTRGVEQTDVVVLYPVSAYQSRLNADRARNVAFEAASRVFATGRDVLFIDDDSIARAEIKDGKLCVAGGAHSVLVLPSSQGIRWTTLAKALELFRAGGTVVALDALPIASDRDGRDDPELNAVVREIFGVDASEFEASGASNATNRNERGGVGVLLTGRDQRAKNMKTGSDGAVSYVREYPGGFAGRWVWFPEPKKEVYFKLRVDSLGAEPREYDARFFCDNEGVLFVNGRKICSGVDYNVGWSGKLTLRDGDVITIDAVDADAPRRGSAGMFFALVDKGETIATAEDFRCSLDGAKNENWRTDSDDFDKLTQVDVGNVHVLHRTGVNTELEGTAAPGASDARLWASFEAALREVPLEVFDAKTGAPCGIMKRATKDADIYFVMRGKKGSNLSFRAQGKVELFDAWSGERREVLDAYRSEDGTTTFCWSYEPQEAGLVVFWKNERPSVDKTSFETNVDALESLEVDSQGACVARGYAAQKGDAPEEKTLRFTTADGTTRELKGVADRPKSTVALDGDWRFELLPTLDNRWGDFRLPISDEKIGAEAQRFQVDGADERLNDFGRKFWLIGPFPQDVDYSRLDALLTRVKKVDPSKPVEFDGKSYSWRPYSFSWRWGIEGNPGREGYHGLKEHIDSRFIGLGKSTEAHNETVFAPEEEGCVYYLWSTVGVKRVKSRDASAKIVDVFVGGDRPSWLFVDGKSFDFGKGESLVVAPEGERSTVLLRYNSAGRRSCCFVARSTQGGEASKLVVLDGNDSGAFNGLSTGLREETPDFLDASTRTPLSTIWFDAPGVLDYDALAGEAPVQRLSFVAPPGLKGLAIPSRGVVRSITINGKEAQGKRATTLVAGKDFWQGKRSSAENADFSDASSFSTRAVRWTTLDLSETVDRASEVCVEIESTPGFYDGALCPEPIRLNCGVGTTTLGDWNDRGVLENYAGGAKYSKTFKLPENYKPGDRVTLNLGNVGVSCRVVLNGETVGDLPAPPWKIDVGRFVKPGENSLDVYVYTSAANFYLNIPSRYKGRSASGLIGTVEVEVEPSVVLRE